MYFDSYSASIFPSAVSSVTVECRAPNKITIRASDPLPDIRIVLLADCITSLFRSHYQGVWFSRKSCYNYRIEQL